AEAEAYLKARLPLCTEQAQAEGRAKKQASPNKGGRGKTARKSFPGSNGQPKEDESARARSRAAVGSGFSATTLAKVTKIREAAGPDRERHGPWTDKTARPAPKTTRVNAALRGPERAGPPGRPPPRPPPLDEDAARVTHGDCLDEVRRPPRRPDLIVVDSP